MQKNVTSMEFRAMVFFLFLIIDGKGIASELAQCEYLLVNFLLSATICFLVGFSFCSLQHFRDIFLTQYG